MEENPLEKITRERFEEIIYESEKILIREIEERQKLYYQFEQLLNETQYYLDKGKRVLYYFNGETGDIKYDIKNKKVGFQK